jgi:hypothetical protein
MKRKHTRKWKKVLKDFKIHYRPLAVFFFDKYESNLIKSIRRLLVHWEYTKETHN